MSDHFDSMIIIPLSRAQSYPHTWPSEASDTDGGIVDLEVHHFVVDVSVHEIGVVTLAASTRQSHLDAYGQEYDLTPVSARALARQLIAAADTCDEPGG